ncbi:glucan biosynthesis protein G [Fontimonas sp. SYSU GA230001]|uniref:glucan biosynthesis protein G n=1 Tax=Fontimonas sp. SYSU GA230001 TaxID=3142450 RepID=UPI0032B33172
MPIIRPLLLLAALALLLPLRAQAASDFDRVARAAEALAGKPYKAPKRDLPAGLAELSYDEYRRIRFLPERARWRNTALPFELQFLHLGMGFNRAVGIHLITSDGIKPVRFAPGDFDYSGSGIDPTALGDLGFAGFRVHYPLNRPDYKDEVLVFQGASFFRALGRGQRYGLSARGLAVDTGELSGEEFPEFTDFWIEWPRAEDRVLTIYALLDAPRVTGAYRFQLKPGEATRLAVTAQLYFRGDVAKLGLAPLTSMYRHGENQPATREDYRPEVHDSDGLSIHSGDEWIWRPLTTSRRLLMTSFGINELRGFGLLQRDRDFGHYEDLGARYDLRPSAWIEPRGDWGRGRVELVSIPAPDETNDNIVAFWVPDRPPRAGDQLRYEYDLSWEMQPDRDMPVARVVQTRRGHGWLREPDDSLRFQIDFQGGALDKLPADVTPVAGIWVGDGGELLERQVVRNEATGGWRVAMRVRRADDSKPLEMRAILRANDQTVSETWAYVLPATVGR